MKYALLLFASVAWASNCARTSVGFTPFTDPYPRPYQGQQVSLYPGGNQPPAAFLALGLQQAAQIVPRDAAGNPDPNGRIVLLSLGLSNTTEEWSAFIPLANADPLKNPRVAMVDGAFGGWTAQMISGNPDQYFSMVAARLQAANVTAAQVQAAWVLLADADPTETFPNDATKLQAELVIVMQQARARFPNLKIAWFSSRIYAGYADTPLNPEPYAYQNAFAVKWLIKEQIDGAAELDVASGKAPWIAWGPYLWADGLKPRFDGLTWACSDFQSDGTHPSPAGAQKVARMLLDFFDSDPAARLWYVTTPPAPVPRVDAVVNSAGYGTSIATGSLATIFGSNLASGTAAATSFPLPHQLLGTRVEIDGVPALLYYVSPAQINFVAPFTGGQPLAVISGGQASNAVTPSITFWAPGLYTLNGAGDVAAEHAGGSVISASSPARPAETIQIFGTGMGIINPMILIAQPAPLVQIAGQHAQVTYAGPAPGIPGVTQINAIVPAGTPSGRQPVVFQLGSASNSAFLAVQ